MSSSDNKIGPPHARAYPSNPIGEQPAVSNLEFLGVSASDQELKSLHLNAPSHLPTLDPMVVAAIHTSGETEESANTLVDSYSVLINASILVDQQKNLWASPDLDQEDESSFMKPGAMFNEFIQEFIEELAQDDSTASVANEKFLQYWKSVADVAINQDTLINEYGFTPYDQTIDGLAEDLQVFALPIIVDGVTRNCFWIGGFSPRQMTSAWNDEEINFSSYGVFPPQYPLPSAYKKLEPHFTLTKNSEIHTPIFLTPTQEKTRFDKAVLRYAGFTEFDENKYKAYTSDDSYLYWDRSKTVEQMETDEALENPQCYSAHYIANFLLKSQQAFYSAQHLLHMNFTLAPQSSSYPNKTYFLNIYKDSEPKELSAVHIWVEGKSLDEMEQIVADYNIDSEIEHLQTPEQTVNYLLSTLPVPEFEWTEDEFSLTSRLSVEPEDESELPTKVETPELSSDRLVTPSQNFRGIDNISPLMFSPILKQTPEKEDIGASSIVYPPAQTRKTLDDFIFDPTKDSPFVKPTIPTRLPFEKVLNIPVVPPVPPEYLEDDSDDDFDT